MRLDYAEKTILRNSGLYSEADIANGTAQSDLNRDDSAFKALCESLKDPKVITKIIKENLTEIISIVMDLTAEEDTGFSDWLFGSETSIGKDAAALYLIDALIDENGDFHFAQFFSRLLKLFPEECCGVFINVFTRLIRTGGMKTLFNSSFQKSINKLLDSHFKDVADTLKNVMRWKSLPPGFRSLRTVSSWERIF